MSVRFCAWLVLLGVSSLELLPIPEYGTPSTRRMYAQSVILNNEIYLFGGVDSGRNLLNLVHSFSLTDKTWTKITPTSTSSPLGRQLFGMFKNTQGIWIAGGQSVNGKLDDFWVFNILSKTWTEIYQLGDRPPPFYGPGYIDYTWNGQEYFMLGCMGTIEDAGTNDLYIFDASDSRWTKLPKVGKTKADGSTHNIPEARRQCNLQFHDGFIYQWGGIPYTSGMFRYDLTAEAWEEIETVGDEPTVVSFFGSVIHDNQFVLLTGWTGGKNTNEIWKTPVGASVTQTSWTKYQIVDDDNFRSYVVMDAYAWAYSAPNVYFHGGYHSSYPVGNFIAKINLSVEPLQTVEEAASYDMPSGRSYHTITPVGSKLYMFGGNDGTKPLDELWIYSSDTNIWEFKEVFGTKPARRQGHCACNHGTNLIIWGGRNNKELYNDMWMYNVVQKAWHEMENKADINPPAVEGACIVSMGANVYIFGGRGENYSNNILWQYILGTNTYEMIAYGAFSSPAATSYHQCFPWGDKILIMHGLTDDLYNPNTIYAWGIETGQWELILSGIQSRARTVADMIDNTIVYMGGSRWNNRARKEIYELDLDTEEETELDSFPFKPWAHAGRYLRNSMFIFGGGGADWSDGNLNQNHASDLFFEYKMGSNYPCSKGSYLLDDDCVLCPRGTFKMFVGNGECVKCPAGTYNDLEGSDDFQFCILCEPGTFNMEDGSPYCYQCPLYVSCSLGATEQIVITAETETKLEDTQPENYMGHKELATSYSNYSLIAVMMFLIIVITLVLSSSKLMKNLELADIFQLKHNYHPGKVMIVRKTKTGGFFALVAFVLIIYIVTQNFLFFEYDNVVEAKALVPIVVVNQNWGKIKGRIEVHVIMYRYGGFCVTPEGACHPAIGFETEGMFGQISDIACSVPENAEAQCMLNAVCDDCELESIAKIEFYSQEFLAFAGALKAEVIAESSIPDEDSILKYEIQPEDNSFVFRGSDPTVFNFLAIPSIFTSENTPVDPAESKGYHMQLGSEYIQGSVQPVQAIDQAGHIRIEIRFEQGAAALHTDRTLVQRALTLMTLLIGSVTGIIAGMGAAMGFVEKNSEKRQIAIAAKREREKIPNDLRLKEYYNDHLKSLEKEQAIKPKLDEDLEVEIGYESDRALSPTHTKSEDKFLEMPSQDV